MNDTVRKLLIWLAVVFVAILYAASMCAIYFWIAGMFGIDRKTAWFVFLMS